MKQVVPSWLRGLVILLVCLSFDLEIHAFRIGDLGEVELRKQTVRFLKFKDSMVRRAVTGSVLIGLTCGVLGSFLVVRRMALTGDVLAHSVMPGVALGFLIHLSKEPSYPIIIGAAVSGLAGLLLVRILRNTTKLGEDAVLGLVLTVFFAVGAALFSMIQRLPSGNKAGLDKLLFGQAATLGQSDLWALAIVSILAFALVTLGFKELFTVSFDSDYARSVGMPVWLIEMAYMLVLALVLVVSLQAVGIVLISALLITPASTAYLMTDKFEKMLFYSGAIGAAAGFFGTFLSFLGNHLPTGPLIVISAALIFATVFLVAPKHGVLTRWWRHRSNSNRINRENVLKSVFHILESKEFADEGVSVLELASKRKETESATLKHLKQLQSFDYITIYPIKGVMYLTPAGWKEACSIVRNHRLWELYLNRDAQVPLDHVHDDAEKIEHFLGEDAVRELEKKLHFPSLDPHGKPIPGLHEISRGLPSPEFPRRTTGFGGG